MLLPISYIIIALVLSWMTVNSNVKEQQGEHTIFLTTNGVHLGIVIPINIADNALLEGVSIEAYDKYLSFGWGDESFYLHTPTWGDLTFKNAFKAVFLRSSTLLHITRFQIQQTDWQAIQITETSLEKLNIYILNTFKTDNNGQKIMLKDEGYGSFDNFFKAEGNYSLFKTCNTWVNKGFKHSGLKSCVWTPFDFGLMSKYR